MATFAKTITDERAAWLARNALPHERALRSWLSSRRLPGLEIDDIIQEAYARLIQAKSLDGVRNPKAYLYQTAWSVLVTHVRREKVISMQTLATVDMLAIEADAPGPEQMVSDQDELMHLAEAIASLPGKVGDVMRLRRVTGLSQKEVAAELGLAESTVEKHMHRGFQLLLKYFTNGGIRASRASNMPSEDTPSDHGQGNRNRDRP